MGQIAEPQNQGDMICRSRIGDRRSFRAARRGGFEGDFGKGSDGLDYWFE
jgi:hypothetical protein